MRIIFITSKLNLETAGGSVPDLEIKARFFSSLGHNVTIVTLFSSANKLETVINPNFKIIEENINTKKMYTIQSGVYKILKKYENSTDIFHVEGQFLYGVGIYKIFGGKIPNILFFNRELVSWPNPSEINFKDQSSLWRTAKRKIRFWLEKYFGTHLGNCHDYSIFTCPQLHDAFHNFGIKKPPFSVISDFVDIEKLKKTSTIQARSVEEASIQKEKFHVLCSGRMIPAKGFDLVINAISQIKNKEKLKVTISGDGPEMNNLKSLASSLNVDKYISFPGWISRQEFLSLMASADFFIQPKWRRELTSVILLEAMAFNLPCIVPAGGGTAWVTSGAALNFVDNDPKSLAEKISEIIENPTLRFKLANNCISRLSELDYHNLGEEMEAIMKSLIT